jgi:hypothetical protein
VKLYCVFTNSLVHSLLFLKRDSYIRRIGRIPVGPINERNKPYGHSNDGIGICGRHIDHPVLSPSSDSHLAHQIGERFIIADADRVHRRSDLLGSLRTLDRLDTDHADKRRDLYLGWNEFVAEVALWMRSTWSPGESSSIHVPMDRAGMCRARHSEWRAASRREIHFRRRELRACCPVQGRHENHERDRAVSVTGSGRDRLWDAAPIGRGK